MVFVVVGRNVGSDWGVICAVVEAILEKEVKIGLSHIGFKL